MSGELATTPLRSTLALDDLLTIDEFCAIAKLDRREVAKKTRKKQILAITFGPKTYRYHLRSIIASKLSERGVPHDLISAMFATVSRTEKRK